MKVLAGLVVAFARIDFGVLAMAFAGLVVHAVINSRVCSGLLQRWAGMLYASYGIPEKVVCVQGITQLAVVNFFVYIKFVVVAWHGVWMVKR